MKSPSQPAGAYHRARNLTLGRVVLGLVVLALAGTASAAPRSPADWFGFPMGADRRLVSYDDFLPYLRHLAEESDRVELRTIGRSTQQRELVMLVISTPGNLAAAPRQKQIAARLHDPVGLTDAEVEALVEEGKTILLVTSNIHAPEILSSQMSLEWAYQLAVGGPRSPARWLEDVIVLLVPSVNPDGQVMVTDWYKEHRGTRYEGCSLPWLYHPYAGHDNNRDWFMLNLPESRAVNRVMYHDWFPQVVVDLHQMGPLGPRIFVPPYADPVTDHVHPLVHRSADLIGSAMTYRLEQAGLSGAIYGYYFDAYWPGGLRSTPWWKNTVGVLVEVASCRVATPIHVDPGELTGGQKGLVDYQPQINFPNPWPGGWWRPADIVEYERVVTNAALETSARRREDFLLDRVRMARDALAPPEFGEPAAYVVSAEQHDPGTASKLVDLLRENGVQGYVTKQPLEQEGHFFPAGSAVFPVTQPLRPFLREMLSSQSYREVRTTDEGAALPPYDVTAWTLPLLMGVSVAELESPVRSPLTTLKGSAWVPASPMVASEEPMLWALSPEYNDSYTAAFRALSPRSEVQQVTTGLEHDDRRFPPGTFLVEATAERMDELLDGLRTVAEPVGAPDGTELGGDPALRRLVAPRVGLYQPWTPSIDEGWTRFVFDTFEVPYTVLHNDDLREGDVLEEFDVLVLPDMPRGEYLLGHGALNRQQQDPRPDPYQHGLGPDGVANLRRFVTDGGLVVALGEASDMAIREFDLPVHNELERNGAGGNADGKTVTPGTLLRVEIDPTHPLGFGMPPTGAVYHTDSPVFTTEIPNPGSDRTVVARYPRHGELVLSGLGQGAEGFRRKAALVEVEMGRGRVVLFGFRPQFRGWTHGTYRLLFNALLDAAAART